MPPSTEPTSSSVRFLSLTVRNTGSGQALDCTASFVNLGEFSWHSFYHQKVDDDWESPRPIGLRWLREFPVIHAKRVQTIHEAVTESLRERVNIIPNIGRSYAVVSFLLNDRDGTRAYVASKRLVPLRLGTVIDAIIEVAGNNCQESKRFQISVRSWEDIEIIRVTWDIFLDRLIDAGVHRLEIFVHEWTPKRIRRAISILKRIKEKLRYDG